MSDLKISSIAMVVMLFTLWIFSTLWLWSFGNAFWANIIQSYIDIPILFFGFTTLMLWFPWWKDEELLFWWYSIAGLVGLALLFAYWYWSIV